MAQKVPAEVRSYSAISCPLRSSKILLAFFGISFLHVRWVTLVILNIMTRVESRRDETRRDDIELGVGYLCIVFNVATQGVSMFVGYI